jgi:hypothetical protein
MADSKEVIFLYVTSFLFLITGFALTGNLFHDTRGEKVYLGNPPIALTATTTNVQSRGLLCTGASVIQSSQSTTVLRVIENSPVICEGTNLSSLVWALSPTPKFVESGKKLKRHSFQVGNGNYPFFKTNPGTNMITIYLGFETDNDDYVGKYEDIFTAVTELPTAQPPDSNVTVIGFYPPTTWIRTPGVMTESASATVGVCLTTLIIGSLLLIMAITLRVLELRKGGANYSTLQ